MEIKVDFEGTPVRFETDSEVFSPSGFDLGTETMLGVVDHVTTEDRLLDLGCGYGVVGILAAKVLGLKSVVMVDVDERAVAVAERNAAANGVDQEVEVFQSDGFSNLEGRTFALILSNPPYHEDFSVPKRFIEDGFSHLEVGGRICFVVKRRLWYENKLRSTFGNVSVIEKNGYCVLEAHKVSESRPKPKTKATTSKHARRLEEAAKRRRRRRT